MRTDQKRKASAIKLRSRGLSIKQIAKKLSAAQSSVSMWTRGVTLTDVQVQMLRSNVHSPVVVEKRRQSRLQNEKVKRDYKIDAAATMVQSLTDRELLLVCTALYWAEGTKKRGAVQFSNGDPRMIIVMLHFLRRVCKVDETKLRCHIHIHEHLDTETAEGYWQRITGISPMQFYRTYNKPNKSSKGTRNSLPHGVCNLYVLDTNLFLKIEGWTRGIYQSVNK